MRLEHITFKGGDDLSVFTPTLTANYSVGALTIRPELRLDSSSEDIFANRDMAAEVREAAKSNPQDLIPQPGFSRTSNLWSLRLSTGCG